LAKIDATDLEILGSTWNGMYTAKPKVVKQAQPTHCLYFLQIEEAMDCPILKAKFCSSNYSQTGVEKEYSNSPKNTSEPEVEGNLHKQ
jgi:hypothetical protein